VNLKADLTVVSSQTYTLRISPRCIPAMKALSPSKFSSACLKSSATYFSFSSNLLSPAMATSPEEKEAMISLAQVFPSSPAVLQIVKLVRTL